MVQTLEPRQLLSASPVGPEFQVNTFTTGLQSTESPRSVAMDADGDFVATWTSFDQDALSSGVYAQRYNAAGVAQGGEFRVNTFTMGAAEYSSVAMDADGDFVVVWSSYTQDGSRDGVYAQRYNAAGVAQGTEFRVNSFTTDNQFFSSVAMDADGDFIVAWTSFGQDGSGYGAYAQRYNAAGIAQGSEFRVNTFTTGDQGNSTVAMDADGDFVVAWASYQDGSYLGVYAQRYNAAGVAQGSEFRVNTFTLDFQADPTVAMDANGDFVITWTGSDGLPIGSYEVYAQRYNASGVAQGSEFRVNTYTSNRQSSSSVAMDADGDFVVTWESDNQDGNFYGVYAQRYNAAGNAQGSEFRVNTFTTHFQAISSVAMDADGDFVVTWASYGQDGSDYGVIAQRYDDVGPDDADDAGPTVTDYLVNGNPLGANEQLVAPPSSATVVFSEGLSTSGGVSGASSALNPANWGLTKNGNNVSGMISGITFGLNVASGKHEAVVSFTAPLTVGDYVLTANGTSTITDLFGNALDGNTDGTPGGDYTRAFRVRTPQAIGNEFRVNTFTTGSQRTFADSPQSVAMDAEGDFVVAWSSFGQGGSAYEVYAQRFNAAGVAQGSEIHVNTFTTNNQAIPSVAMDADGDFVITWTSTGQDGNLDGVYARRYNAAGVAQGNEFRVNTFTTSSQGRSRVAMNADGDFVITWTSSGQDDSSFGVYAQRYSATGMALGSEFRVNTYTTDRQTHAMVAMDADGDFVITWSSYSQDGSVYGVYAQRYSAAGVALGSEFRVNTFTTGHQLRSTVAMDSDGDFVVTWTSSGQDSGTDGVYAQRFNATGVAQGSEFRVNTLTTGEQHFSTVAVDADGDFVVAWTSAPTAPPPSITDGDGDLSSAESSEAQVDSDYGVYAQRYNAAGVALGSEFLVNTFTIGNQQFSSVAMDADGNFVVAWSSAGQDGSAYGVYAQRYAGGNRPTDITASPVAENLPSGTPVSLTTVDQDGPESFTYALVAGAGDSDNASFQVVDGQVHTAAVFDFETKNAYAIRVQVTDVGGLTFEKPLTIDVTNLTEAAIVDDGDTGFITTGPWVTHTSSGRGSDLRWVGNSAAVGVEATATWVFSSISSGQYNVSATWPETNNRATNVPYRIRETLVSPILATATINQMLAPDDLNAQGSLWEDLGVVNVQGNTLVMQLSNVGVDYYVIADAIRVERVGDVPIAPEITVETSSGQGINDGGSHDFGDTTIGTPVSRTFRIYNVGGSDLIVQPATVPTGFTVTANIGSPSQTIAPGSFFDIVVRLDASSAGPFGGELSIASNDSDETAFNILISGDVFAPADLPVLQILDDGDSGFNTTGTWVTYPFSGRGSDIRYLSANEPAGVATWAFSELTSGLYRVSATWPPADNRATNAPYSLRGSLGGPVQVAKTINQKSSPNDLTDQGSAWEDLGVVTVLNSTLFVELTNVGANKYVIADAIRIERIGPVPIEPEIAVMDLAGQGISDGGALDFGDTLVGTPVSITLDVHNVGNTNLVLQPATLPDGFSFVGSNFTAGQVVVPGANTVLMVRLDATSPGSFSGPLSFATNDSDENPFNFLISGDVFAPADVPVLQIIDDGVAGYSTSGAWVNWNSNGRDGDLQYLTHTADPAGVATWAFTGLTAGQYRVSTTWTEHANRASDAPYFVRETAGGPVLAVKEVNQKVAPNDLNDQGSLWEDLGTVTIHGNTLQVELTSAGADGYVIADAVRIERLGPVPVEPEIVAMSLTGNAPAVDDTGSIDFGDTTTGTPVSRTFRIHNVGSADLVVQPATVTSEFTVTTNFGVNQTIAQGAFFDIVVQLDAGTPGTIDGQVSFATNDGDENPFNFTVTGDVFPSGEVPVLQIVDDGDAAFTLASGNWENWALGGRGSDLKYLNAVGVANWPSGNLATTGLARWTFNALPDGQYRVSATWPGDTNRATNSAFTILDAIGGNTLGNASINQVSNPNDFSDQGSLWEDLGTVNINAGTLVVELTNTGANTYVIADAIRIERLGPPVVMEAGLTAGDPVASATGAPETKYSAAPAPLALLSKPNTSRAAESAGRSRTRPALADLSAYSVPLDGRASSALYELWQGAV